MKRIILFSLVNIICVLSFSQGIYIKNKNYKGYIFPKECDVDVFPRTPNSFTPSAEDVEEAERILREYFQNRSFEINDEYPLINKKTLKDYYRQYIGEIKNGNKIIFINFIHKTEKDTSLSEEMKKQLIYVLDGGTYYWRIYVDITSGKVLEMTVNGIA